MEQQLIDDAFYVKRQKWGTWDSFDKENKCIVTSLTEESCIAATRAYLKWKQEGTLNQKTEKTYEATVGGKL
jgi:hypothetical protein